MSDHSRPFTIDTDRRGRGVQIALILIGIPFVVSLAGLGLRSPLSELELPDEGLLTIGAAACKSRPKTALVPGWRLSPSHQVFQAAHSAAISTR